MLLVSVTLTSKLAHLRSRRRQYPSDDPYTNGAVGPRRSSYPTTEHRQPLLHSSPSFSSPHHSLPSQAPPVQETMTGRDRTAEFTSVVRSLQSYHVRSSCNSVTEMREMIRFMVILSCTILVPRPFYMYVSTYIEGFGNQTNHVHVCVYLISIYL